MEKKKTMGILVAMILILVVVSVVGITYAAFTQELTINGSATVNKSSWKIQFQDLQSAITTGTAKELTAPTIDSGDTKIGTYAVTLTTPGDSISYKVTVKNAGTFNAKLSSITVPKPTCESSAASAEDDKKNVCEHLEYQITYAEGGAINLNDELNAGATRELKLTLKYKEDITAEELPKDDVTITNLQVTLIYAQAPTTFY